MKKATDTSLIILYEVGHVDVILAYFGVEKLKRGSGFIVAPVDYEIELKLKSLGIPHQSLREYHPRSPLRDRVQASGLLMRNWHQSRELNFFQHKGIPIGSVVEYSLGEYLLRILYYFDIFSYILDSAKNIDTVYVPESTVILSPTVGQLAKFEISAPRETVTFLARARGFDVQVFARPVSVASKKKFHRMARSWAKIGTRATFKLLNSVIAIFRKKSAMKIFVSDYWWHVNSFIPTMHNVEITMMDRKEIQNAKVYIWKKKIRFNQIGDYVTRAIRKDAKKVRVGYETAWNALNEDAPFKKEFTYQGAMFWEIVKPAYDHLVTSFSLKVVESIDGAERLFKKQDIHAVILRASVSGQIHFSILAFVARMLRIPAIELQHGLEYMDTISHSIKKTANVIASYGTLIQRDLAQANDPSLAILSIGSPRFDGYLNMVIPEEKKNDLRKKLGVDAQRPVILYVAPDIVIGQTYDSYDVVRTFKNLSALYDIDNIQIVVKIRPGPERETFFKKVLEETLGSKYFLAQYENMQELFSISTIVVSCFSTVALEAMIAQKPLILDGINPNDLMIIESHFLPYEQAQALRVARTEEDLVRHTRTLVLSTGEAQKLAHNANNFLQKNYCFDGKSAERMADFLETLRK